MITTEVEAKDLQIGDRILLGVKGFQWQVRIVRVSLRKGRLLIQWADEIGDGSISGLNVDIAPDRKLLKVVQEVLQ